MAKGVGEQAQIEQDKGGQEGEASGEDGRLNDDRPIRLPFGGQAQGDEDVNDAQRGPRQGQLRNARAAIRLGGGRGDGHENAAPAQPTRPCLPHTGQPHHGREEEVGNGRGTETAEGDGGGEKHQQGSEGLKGECGMRNGDCGIKSPLLLRASAPLPKINPRDNSQPHPMPSKVGVGEQEEPVLGEGDGDGQGGEGGNEREAVGVDGQGEAQYAYAQPPCDGNGQSHVCAKVAEKGEEQTRAHRGGAQAQSHVLERPTQEPQPLIERLTAELQEQGEGDRGHLPPLPRNIAPIERGRNETGGGESDEVAEKFGAEGEGGGGVGHKANGRGDQPNRRPTPFGKAARDVKGVKIERDEEGGYGRESDA